MSTLSIAERVAAGVAWLDANVPGWLECTDLKRLDVGSRCDCILGQQFGNFSRAPEVASQEGAVSMGFDIDTSIKHEQAAYKRLTVEWRRVIEERRAQTAGAAS